MTRAFDMPYGQVQAGLGKLFTDLGEDGPQVLSQLDTNPSYRRRVANFAIAGGWAPSGEQRPVVSDFIREWESFYSRYFGLEVALSSVTVPDDPGGFPRVLYVAQDLTPHLAFKACWFRFSGQCSWGFGTRCLKVESDRVPTVTYAIRVRGHREPDDEQRFRSAEELVGRGVPGITLLEHLIFALKYFDETARLLQAVTLCSGSRNASGGVPYTRTRWGKFRISSCSASRVRKNMRTREVVAE